MDPLPYKLLYSTDITPHQTANLPDAWLAPTTSSRVWIIQFQDVAFAHALLLNLKTRAKLSVFISLEESINYVKVFEDLSIAAGSPRKVNIGNMPCKYLKLCIGKTVGLKRKDVEVLGVPGTAINSIIPDTEDLLIKRPLTILF
ncbi:unnamed protein product [Blepharisma stoltei]|uniref:Uncharacterized protein n=1 Tax=Blepharisma stoltei TaxID=1481888 RepID=A0AAU9IKV0_9CILI|nr:unnamed protein product [Blepharisma stoltei]